jgi:hypothetical protein
MDEIHSPFRALIGIVVLAAIAGAATAGEVTHLRAGAAAIDITPKEFPVNTPGGFRAKLSQKAHDPLHSRALVLDNGAVTLAVVVVDSLGVSPETGNEARAAAASACGISPERILIASTHSHSAPPSNRKKGLPGDVAYRKVLLEGITESIVKAHKALRPAAAAQAAHALPEEVFNRRWYLKPGKMPLNPFGEMDKVKMNPGRGPDVLDRPAGPVDPDVTILSVRDAKTRKPLALLANYALHYVGGVPRGELSADYFGEFARLVPSRVRGAEGFVAMMSNGASGDINNIPFNVTRPPREPYEQIRIVARKAADAAWHAWKKIDKHDPGARLGMVRREITLKMRRPTEKQVESAKKIAAMKDEAELARLPRLADIYARRVISLSKAPDTIKVELQALRVGDLAICAIPFETFVEIGLDLKKRSPFPRTMVIGLGNGCHGYLPTPAQHKLGGYETWLGTCRVQKDASVIITDELLEMLGELAKDK